MFGHQTSEVFFFCRPTILLPFSYAQFAHMMCKTSPTCKKTAVLYSSAVLRRSLPSYSDNIRFVGRVVDLGRWIRPKILLYPRYSFTLWRRKRGEIVSSSSVHNRQPTVFSGSNLILDPGSSPLLLPRGRLLWRGRRAPPLYFGYSTAANAMSAFGGGESEKIATKIAL